MTPAIIEMMFSQIGIRVKLIKLHQEVVESLPAKTSDESSSPVSLILAHKHRICSSVHFPVVVLLQ